MRVDGGDRDHIEGPESAASRGAARLGGRRHDAWRHPALGGRRARRGGADADANGSAGSHGRGARAGARERRQGRRGRRGEGRRQGRADDVPRRAQAAAWGGVTGRARPRTSISAVSERNCDSHARSRQTPLPSPLGHAGSAPLHRGVGRAKSRASDGSVTQSRLRARGQELAVSGLLAPLTFSLPQCGAAAVAPSAFAITPRTSRREVNHAMPMGPSHDSCGRCHRPYARGSLVSGKGARRASLASASIHDAGLDDRAMIGGYDEVHSSRSSSSHARARPLRTRDDVVPRYRNQDTMRSTTRAGRRKQAALAGISGRQ